MRLDGIRQDLTGGVRGLMRAPGFALAALLTLALGIGATSAIFTVVKAVLLTPLPYAQADTRVLLWSRWISFDKTWLSDQELLDYRRLATTLTAVAGLDHRPAESHRRRRARAGQRRARHGQHVRRARRRARSSAAPSPRPRTCRTAAPVAVLGYGLWQSRYGGDPTVVGRRIQLERSCRSRSWA